jgi:SPP1 family predicted phage head-tail adaptor
MKCCDITAGDLRNKIYIQRLTLVPDDMGGFEKTWTTIATPKARVRGLTGTEHWEAQRVHPGNLKRVIIRWRGDDYQAPYYTEADRIMFQNREHGILTVMDIENHQKWLQIDMLEGRAS